MFNISIAQIRYEYDQMRFKCFTILEELKIKSTLPMQITILQLLLFHKSNQVKCWLLMRGENRITREKKPLIAE